MAMRNNRGLLYERGSEWRRWDLHVHTPHSALHHEFGNDFDAYAGTLFERAVESKIAVIGVTDYFIVDGFRELSALQQDDARLEGLLGPELAAQAKDITLLANVELRLSTIIDSTRGSARVNLHVLFAEDVSADVIEAEFLHRLQFRTRSGPAGDAKRTLTKPHLELLGRQLKEEHEPFRERSDLEVGMEQAGIDDEQISDVLRTSSLSGRYLIVLDQDEDLSKVRWNSQSHQARKLLVCGSQMLFSANEGTRDFGLGRHADTPEAFIEEFGSLKPCVHGSDAHRFEDLFRFADDRYLWVCADPTFNGLRQLLYGPAERVHIGSEPPTLTRAKERVTKTIDRVEFQRLSTADAASQWFAGEVLLSQGLVAVIGRKGSGKSALADIVALVGNAQGSGEFAFLTQARFLAPRQKLGSKFSAELVWRSGDRQLRRLDDALDPSLPAQVKYIPQRRLEQICEEVQHSSSPSEFERELEAVIFSHVPQAERLGFVDLRQLLEHLTAERETRIQDLRQKLSKTNSEYSALSDQSSPENRRRVEAELKQKQAQREAHIANKPQVVEAPRSEEPGNEPTPTAVALKGVVARIKEFDQRIGIANRAQEDKVRRRVAAERMLTRIDNLRKRVDEFYVDSREDAELLGISPQSVVSLETTVSQLEALHARTSEEAVDLAKSLDPANPSSLVSERAAASAEAEKLRDDMSAPERRYQEHQRALANWERTLEQIDGSDSDPGSVRGLEKQLSLLDGIPARLAEFETRRVAIALEILDAKLGLVTTFRALYEPVQEFIDRQTVAKDVASLSFSASLVVDGFTDGLLDMLHQGRRGSFQGDAGRARLEALVESHDLMTAEGAQGFLSDLQEHLHTDARDGGEASVRLGDQLRKGRTPVDVYDFILGLDYLRPRFELKWREKAVDQLSPGERGTLLLIFYLLIDPDDRPLVIDQPEENLDNETVSELLVPAIKHAKERRQIIVVTHNPNLAVVCDADQIIHASIDKVDGSRITYTSGSIENPQINRMIVNVLEGTKPAFDLRDDKYEVADHATAQ